MKLTDRNLYPKGTLWRLLVVGLVMALLAACVTTAPPAAPQAAEQAQPAAEEKPAAAEEAEVVEGELREVPRNRTLIIMNGGPNQYALFDNQNPYIPGSDAGFHMGTLPATFEPLIMFNVLTGEYENWLAESWE